MVKRRPSPASRARRIALILMDVDGVLTDGRIRYADAGGEIKTFDARDGAGLVLARRAGLRTGLISGRGGPAVRRRAVELGMSEIHLRTKDKLAAYVGILEAGGLEDAQVCYVGDDLVDLPVLARAGLAVAVADAHPEVRRRVDFVTRAGGGRGAVREVVDTILRAQGRWDEVIGWFAVGGRRR
jgi:3-deoxy-D-manno-octulosonate 8-phosphate phosphatase (KDO 8-P phosphatase)